MIDTDKYEGHTEGPWELSGYFSNGWKIYWFDKEMSDNWDSIRDFGEEYRHEHFCHDVGVVASTEANAKLMADAPLLLAEVKRLRERLGIVEDFVHGLRRYVSGNAFDHIMFDMRKALGDEEE
tara:strand:+ start:49 stop:417 length:369 start_codon:yes stop_codon:yes gene_type:complete